MLILRVDQRHCGICMQKYFIGLLIMGLLITTYATLPRVDHAEANALFYFQHLTLLYYASVFVTIAVAIYWRRSFLGLFSAIVFGLLIFFTPSVMCVQPWFPDTYPFVAEAVYAQRNGHLGEFHYLSVNPVIGLFFAPLLMMTSIDPFMLVKIYPAFIAIFFSVALYLIGKKMGIAKGSLVIAPLLFFSIAWPNEFHFSRQSFSLVFYLISFFLTLHLISSKADRRVFALLVLQIVILTMSHPATPLIFIVNLVAIIIVSKIFQGSKLTKAHELTIFRVMMVSIVSWFLWNTFNPTGAIYSLEAIMQRFFVSLLESPTNPAGTARIFGGYTPIYRLTINIRLALTLVAFATASAFLLFLIRRFRACKASTFILGWFASNLLTAIPLLYAGLPYSSRPILFTIIAWAPLGALFYGIPDVAHNSWLAMRVRRIAKSAFIVGLILVPTLLMPAIKYGPLPFLYPTSKELANKYFLDLHLVGDETLVYLEYNIPWAYSYVRGESMIDMRETKVFLAYDVYVPGEGLNKSITDKASIWVTERLLTRDGFWINTPSMLDVAEDAVNELTEARHHKVYDSGGFESILKPTAR